MTKGIKQKGSELQSGAHIGAHTGADGRIQTILGASQGAGFMPRVPTVKASAYRALPTEGQKSTRKKGRAELGKKERADLLSGVLSELVRSEGNYLRLSSMTTSKRNASDVAQIQAAKRAINSQISQRLDSVARGLGLTKEEVCRRYLPKSMDGLWFVSVDELSHKAPSDFLRSEIAKLMADH